MYNDNPIYTIYTIYYICLCDAIVEINHFLKYIKIENSYFKM